MWLILPAGNGWGGLSEHELSDHCVSIHRRGVCSSSEYMTSLVACYFKYQGVKEFHMLAGVL